jgi:predicted transcriptional regulator
MAILGTAELGAVDSHDPDVAWKEHEHNLGLTREEFTTYLKGSDSAHLLHIQKPRTLNEPIPLSHLRASANTFKPPQSFRYITPQDPLPLLTAASAATR